MNSSQTLAAGYKYDPYGNTLAMTGSLASANVYRFSSKELHVNSGLYYYGYRWYHPNLQRWLNRDPIGENGFETLRGNDADPLGDGPNLYAFVENTPVSHLDFWGLSACTDQCYKDFEDAMDKNLKDLGKCVAFGYAFCAARKAGPPCYGWVTIACGLKAAHDEVAATARLAGCLDGCLDPDDCVPPLFDLGQSFGY
jgi:RHS repeat-associated protein